MKNSMVGVALLTLLQGCGLQGSGEIVTIRPQINEPVRLEVCCGFDVTVRQGTEATLSVRGDDNILDQLLIEQRGDRLLIDVRQGIGWLQPSEPVRIDVTLTELLELTGSGGIDLVIEPMKTPSLDIELSGGSEASIDGLDTPRLSLVGSGGSDINLQGRAKRLDVELSGGGDLDAFSCESERVELDLSGGSAARVSASEWLGAEISGGSEVVYRGEPELSTEASGGSTVRAE